MSKHLFFIIASRSYVFEGVEGKDIGKKYYKQLSADIKKINIKTRFVSPKGPRTIIFLILL